LNKLTGWHQSIKESFSGYNKSSQNSDLGIDEINDKVKVIEEDGSLPSQGYTCRKWAKQGKPDGKSGPLQPIASLSHLQKRKTTFGIQLKRSPRSSRNCCITSNKET
jgi:hypothetical protein